MKLLLAYLIIGVACLPSQLSGNQHKQKENTRQSETRENSEQPRTVVNNSVNCEPGKIEPSHQAKVDANHPHDWIEKLNAFSTLIVALFTVFLFFGVVYQVRTARGSERAWIVIRELRPPEHLSWHEFTATHVKQLEGELKFTNTGRTPAVLRNMRAKFDVVESIEKMTSVPDYGLNVQHPDIPKYGRMLVHNESLKTSLTFDGSGGLATFHEEIQSIIAAKKTMVLYGIVEYTDVFKRPHEFRFCYVWHPLRAGVPTRGFRLGGPPKYNKAN